MSTRTFRVFVSSTFTDWQLEREALRTRVFPRLQSLCRSRGGRFQAIDLRWGISEAAAHDQQTLQICFREIDRCRQWSSPPNFIALLGDRYGWRPPPDLIPAREFEPIRGCLGAEDRALVEGRYRRDDNAVETVYRLLPRSRDDDYAEWQAVERMLCRALRQAASELGFDPQHARKYTSSVTEQEIARRGLLGDVPDASEAFCCFRRIEGLPDDVRTPYSDTDEKGRRDLDARDRLEALKDALRARLPANVREYEAAWRDGEMSSGHLDQFCEDVYTRLSGAMLSVLTEHLSADATEEEIESHEAFGGERRRFFVGRMHALAAIERYLSERSAVPLVVYGHSGSGKTALMAKAVADARTQHPSARVLCRFVGATPGSSDVPALLSSLWREIGRRFSGEETAVPDNYPDLVRSFWDACGMASEESPLILFIDSLDQLSPLHDASSLSWLPAELPQHVHVIVSTIPGDTLRTFEQLVPDASRYELDALPIDDAQTLLNRWLGDAGRRLQEDQHKTVLQGFASNGLPLYLRLAFEEACRWHSDSTVQPLAPSVQGIIRALCARLSAGNSHGSTLVSRSLSYLAAAKHGLSHDEVRDVLSRDGQVIEDFRQRSVQPLPDGDPLPIVIWSRLFFDLAPYLVERAAGGLATLDFFHRQLREVIEEDYLDHDARLERHAALARYFADQRYEERKAGSTKAPNVRKPAEWPYQLTRGELWSELDQVLMDFDFVEAKVTELGPGAFVEDFDLPGAFGGWDKLDRAIGGTGHLRALQEALRLSSRVLTADPTHLSGQLLGRLREASGVTRLLAQAVRGPGVPWLQPRTASLTPPGGPLLRSLSVNNVVSALSITVDGACAVIGCEDGTIRIADLTRAQERSRFRIHPSKVTALATIDLDRAVSGDADGTIKVWDLRTGAERLRLEGHTKEVSAIAVTRDERHLVSGSRDGTLRTWSLADGSQARVFDTGGNVAALAVTADGQRVLFGSDNVLRLWSLVQEGEIQRVRVNDGEVLSVALTPDGRRAVVGTGDLSTARFNLRIWSLEPWEELHRVEGQRWVGSAAGHTGSITAIAVMPRGDVAVSGSDDRTVRVWDLTSYQLTSILRGHDGPVRNVVVAPDGHSTVSSSGSVLCHWSMASLHPATHVPHAGSVSRVMASDEARRACSSDRYGGTCMWDLRDRDRIGSATIHLETLTPLALTPDFRVAAASSHDYQAHAERAILTVWDLERGRVVGRTSMGDSAITAAAFTRGASQIIVGLDSGALCLVDAATLREVKRLGGHIEGVDHLACVDEGRLVVSGSRDGSIRVWDLTTGREIGRLDNVTGVPALAVTPDGKRAVSGSDFGRIHVWDLEHQRLVHEIVHGAGTQNFSVLGVAITPDGSRILSGGTDNNIRVWDAHSGNPIATFVAEDWTMCATTVGSDLFVVGSQNGAVHMLSLSSLLSQSDERLDEHGASRRDPGRQQSDDGDEQRGAGGEGRIS